MVEKAESKSKVLNLIVENALRFFFNLVFIIVFQTLFGVENTLAGVAISVGWTMFPMGYGGVKPLTMSGVIIGLYAGSAVVAQFALGSPWIALPINFLFVASILLLSSEPMIMKPSISFLLSFVFCQATPVAPEQFSRRLLGMMIGGAFVVLTSLIYWKKDGVGKDGRTLIEQVNLCKSNKGYILRMSIGIAIAMFVAMVFKLQKPLWISIVVMSLTQVSFEETIERIKHRSLATILGVIFFIVFFNMIIPKEYSMLGILLLGYISFFTPEYKHKQVVNAISALNASLIFLDTTTAIENRILCLVGGIIIVIFMWKIQEPIKRIGRKLSYIFKWDLIEA